MDNQFNIPPIEPKLEPEPKSMGWAKGLIVILIIIALGAAAAWGYPNYWGLRGSDAEADVVLAQAIENLKNVNSSRTEGELSFRVTGSSPSLPTSLKINWAGAAEGKVPLESSGFLTLRLLSEELPPEAKIFLPTGKLEINLDLRKIASTVYLKLSGLPQTPFVDLTKVSDRWAKVDLTEYGPYVDQAMTAEGEALLSELINIVKTKHPFKVKEIEAYHYGLELDKNKLREFVVALSQSAIFKNASIPPEDLPTDEEWAKAMAELDKIDLPEIEVWIDERKMLINRVAVRGVFKSPPDAPEDFTLEYAFDQKQTGWDEPVVVEAPAESVPIEQLTTELGFGPSPSATSTPGQE